MVISIYFLQRNRVFMGVLFFAVASSMKGGAIVYLPGLLVLLTFAKGIILGPVLALIFIVAFHLVIGYPFYS